MLRCSDAVVLLGPSQSRGVTWYFSKKWKLFFFYYSLCFDSEDWLTYPWAFFKKWRSMSLFITMTILLHFLRKLMDATVALMLPDVKKDCIFILKNSNTHVILYSTMALFNSHLVFKTYRTNKSFHICINKLNRIHLKSADWACSH